MLEESRKGSISMLIKRAKTPAVLPGVNRADDQVAGEPACTAMAAVSGSRISPTMMTCGSWRMSERKRFWISEFLREVHLRLRDHRQVEFNGSSTVAMLMLGAGALDQCVKRRINRGRFSGAGRASEQDQAAGFIEEF